MLFFLSTLLPLFLFGTLAAGDEDQIRQYTRIPEQTITYEQLNGPPESRVIELAPTNNVLHLHFDNSALFGTRKSSVGQPSPASISPAPSPVPAPVPVSQDNTGVSGRPAGSYMRRTSYVRPEVYMPPVQHHQQYSVPSFQHTSVPVPVPSFDSQPKNAYPVPRTYYVPAQPIPRNPNMVRIVPSTFQTMTPYQGRPRTIETIVSSIKPSHPKAQPYTINQPHVIRIVNPTQWINAQPAVQEGVISVPTIVPQTEPKYTLITINSPINTDIPPFQKVFPSTVTSNTGNTGLTGSAGMTGSQNFDRVAVPISGRSNEFEPLMVRAASFSSQPKTEVRAPRFKERKVSRTAGGIIVHRLEEGSNRSKEEPKPERDVHIVKKDENTKIEMDQPTVALAVPVNDSKDKVDLEAAKIEAKPVEVDVGIVSARSAPKNNDGFNVEKIEQTKEDTTDEVMES